MAEIRGDMATKTLLGCAKAAFKYAIDWSELRGPP